MKVPIFSIELVHRGVPEERRFAFDVMKNNLWRGAGNGHVRVEGRFDNATRIRVLQGQEVNVSLVSN